jgi:hypothetical protein
VNKLRTNKDIIKKKEEKEENRKRKREKKRMEKRRKSKSLDSYLNPGTFSSRLSPEFGQISVLF